MNYSSTTQISSAFANYGARIAKVSKAIKYGNKSIASQTQNNSNVNNNKNTTQTQKGIGKAYLQITRNAKEGINALNKVRSAYSELQEYSSKLYNIGKTLTTDTFLNTNEQGVLNGLTANITSKIDEVVSNTKINNNNLIGTSSKTFTIGLFLHSPQYNMTIGPISSLSSKTLANEALDSSASLDEELTQLKGQVDANYFPIEQIMIISEVGHNTNYAKNSHYDSTNNTILHNKGAISDKSSSYIINKIESKESIHNLENIKKIDTKA